MPVDHILHGMRDKLYKTKETIMELLHQSLLDGVVFCYHLIAIVMMSKLLKMENQPEHLLPSK